MLKNILKRITALMLMVLVSFAAFGCGELSFEDTPYGESDKTAGEIITFYNSAYAGNLQLKAKYEGSSTHVSGNTTTKTDYTYIIGKIGNDNYCKVDQNISVNGIPYQSISTIYYKDTKATATTSTVTGTTTKIKEYFRTDNINRDLLLTIFPTLYEESIELTGHKVYEEEHYYKVTLTKDSVNDEFSNPVLTIPENTYITYYSYAFGVNKGGYISYFVLEYDLEDSSRTTVATFTSTIKLIPPYGADMYIGEAPNFGDYIDPTQGGGSGGGSGSEPTPGGSES